MSRTATAITDLRQLVEQTFRLAQQIRTAHTRLKGADDEPTRRAGYRLDTAAGYLNQAIGEINATIGDLTRITTRGTCAADWGLCPEHGNTLTRTRRRTWCQRGGCRLRWDHDRGSLPCTEPAAYQVRDTTGGQMLLCGGHADDARQRLNGARLTPITAGSNR